MATTRRVAVTGLGAISALGHDMHSLWGGLLDGRSGIARSPGQPWPQARVTGYEPGAHFSSRELALLDPVSQWALVAAREAMAAAGLQGPADADIDPQRSGAVFGAGLGHHTLDEGYQAFYGRQAARLHPLLVPRGMPSAPASQLSIAYGLQGPTLATATACASAAHALGLAFHFIRAGLLDFALSGGAEAALVPGMVKAWEGLRVLSADTCRPFSRDRSGLVLGEGAAVLVLEEWQLALRRGAVPLAEVVGFGMGADAADITAPSPHGAVQAMRSALADAGLSADQVDYVNAHGTGTRLNDRCEAQALAQSSARAWLVCRCRPARGSWATRLTRPVRWKHWPRCSRCATACCHRPQTSTSPTRSVGRWIACPMSHAGSRCSWRCPTPSPSVA
jgi:nodulation protein E